MPQILCPVSVFFWYPNPWPQSGVKECCVSDPQGSQHPRFILQAQDSVLEAVDCPHVHVITATLG